MKFSIPGVLLLGSLFSAPQALARLGPTSRETSEKSQHSAIQLPLPKSVQDSKYIDKPAGQENSFKTRIVGGEAVSSPQDFPFFVSWGGQCGGSLIRSDIVMTAAHCDEIFSDFLTVNAFRVDDSSTAGAVTRSIVARSIHPDYNTVTLANDFLLLKLSSPVTSVVPIELNTDPEVPKAGQNLTVIGMGLTFENGLQPSVLQRANLNALSDQDCNVLYSGGVVEDRMFCASADGRDSCQGDSGGPIFTMTDSGTFDKLVGVVSWGFGCARPQYPGVYAEISAINDWVFQETCRLSAEQPEGCPEPTPPPTPTPPGIGEAQVTINIVTDRFPSETSWFLLDGAGSVVDSVPFGTYNEAETLFTKQVNLKIGEQYTFVIEDEADDGICCLYGNGEYYLEAHGTVLISGGAFTSSDSRPFVVPEAGSPVAPATPPPTPAPTPTSGGGVPLTPPPTPSLTIPPNNQCDDTEGTITLDGNTEEEKSCAWLGRNRDRYGYLCQFVDVAVICPATCQWCSLFAAQ